MNHQNLIIYIISKFVYIIRKMCISKCIFSYFVSVNFFYVSTASSAAHDIITICWYGNICRVNDAKESINICVTSSYYYI